MERKLSVYLQDDLFHKMEEVCRAYGLSKADFCRLAIRHELERLGLIEALSIPETLTPIKTREG